MTTAREHMQADMEWLFAQEGESVRDVDLTLPGREKQTLRAAVRFVETDPSAYEGSAVIRVDVAVLATAIADVAIGRRVVFDGSTYDVEAFYPGSIIKRMTLARVTA